ncbi:MAG: hypothetical protein LIP18_02245 [Planctomycetes bacterium]|nr:hypothetical protein [Planctomycetota bacterium]
MRFDPPRLQDELSRRTGLAVMLFLNSNRRRMVSARQRGPGAVEVRLQRAFLDSPDDVLSELAQLILGRHTDKLALRRFIDSAFRENPEQGRPRRQVGVDRQVSSHHDIERYARDLNDIYLGGRSTARVVWGRKGKRRSRRSIRFACYDPERNLVIMNRKLDSAAIPAYFVEYVLFPEMLPEVLGSGARPDGRRDGPGSLLQLMDSTYPDSDQARRFERELCKHLDKL